MLTKMLTSPSGKLTVMLDRREVSPDDPGAGTPALVVTTNGSHEGTLWCAIAERELSCGGDGVYRLASADVRWLSSLLPEVDLFLAQ